ncbi:MAG: rhodanese-related sulfurtransferase [Bacteroidota bacterium]
MDTQAYRILLYYCYVPVEDPESYREEHHALCLRLNLRGRIIIASEGINGTVSGLTSDCEAYMAALHADTRFADIDFKIEANEGHSFNKLYVRVKEEIVNADLQHVKPYEATGIHLSPADFRNIKNDPDVVLLDVRSNYEHGVGRFKNALTLDMENFREFPERVEELAKDPSLEGKKIVTYCTGGIKCEKASAYLLERGFKNVYQLHGGIIKYGIEEGGEDFEGKCYVFDNRVAVDVNSVNPTVVSTCHICGTLSDRMVNCANAECNLHAPVCEACGITMEGACSEECRTHEAKRPYDGTGAYPKQLNGYDPYHNSVRKKRNAHAGSEA